MPFLRKVGKYLALIAVNKDWVIAAIKDNL
jgi:hypothetical protein